MPKFLEVTNKSAARNAIEVYSRAQTVGQVDELPNESGFWWVSEPVAVDGRVFMGTVAADRGAWLQEWTQPVDGGPFWLHRYFIGWTAVATSGGQAPESMRDDHTPAVVAAAAGKPLVVFWTNHSADEAFRWRISDQNVDAAGPGELTFGETRSFQTGNPNNYVQVMHTGNDLWVCHRESWATTVNGVVGISSSDWHLTKIPNWGTGAPVTYKLVNSVDQAYLKARMVNGVIRIMSSDHPTLASGNKIWYCEVNTTTGAVTKADGTVLGNLSGTNLPLQQSSLDEVFTATGNSRPWLFDVGYGSARELVFSDGVPANYADTAKYKYARYANGAWTVSDICQIGNFFNGAIFPSITFVPGNTSQVLLARATTTTPTGTNFVEKWQTNNNGASWFNAETVDSATVDASNYSQYSGVRRALTRAYPVRVESGTAPFSVIATDMYQYASFAFGWTMYVRPLPLSHPVKRVPADQPVRRGLDAEFRRRPAPTSGLYLPGTTLNWVEGPTSVAVPAAGVRLEVDVALADWRPGVPKTLFGKSGANASNLGPRLMLNGDGKVGFYWSVNGTTPLSVIPNALLPSTDWQRIQLAVDFVPSANKGANYQIRTWYRYSYEESWRNLAFETVVGATSLFSGTAPWQINGRNQGATETAEGVWYRATVMTLAQQVLAEWRADLGHTRQKDQQNNLWNVNATIRLTAPSLVLPRVDAILDTSGRAAAEFVSSGSGNNYLQIQGSDSSPSIVAVGSSTNIPMVFVPKGNGAFQILSPGTPELQGWGTSGTANFNITTQSTGVVQINGAAALFAGGALGTPSSGTLTNCTGLPVTGITASTSAALGVGSVELGHATDTTIARKSAGIITVEGADVVTDIDHPHDLDSGEATMRRRDINSTSINPSNSIVRMTYFTARRTETIGNVRAMVNTGQVGATLMRIGIYEVNATTGDLTLVASTANDTALFNTVGVNTKALSASFTKTRGKRYAVAVLQVGATTAALLSGSAFIGGTVAGYAPRQSAFVSGTDLPATVTAASLGDSGSQIWVALIP